MGVFAKKLEINILKVDGALAIFSLKKTFDFFLQILRNFSR